MNIAAIILAAGRGTRMNSTLPKVLHPLAKKPLLQYVLDAASSVLPQQIVVVCGYKAELVQQKFSHLPIDWAIQEQQIGTGDAVRCALPFVKPTDKVLVLCGDVPLIQIKTLQEFVKNTPEQAVGLITVKTDRPQGLGRILRDATDKVIQIVEEKDASEQQKAIKEINAGIYLLPYVKLESWLSKISTDNKQQELYLTDVIQLAVQDGLEVYSHSVQTAEEVMGVNTRVQLAELEKYYQRQHAEALM